MTKQTLSEPQPDWFPIGRAPFLDGSFIEQIGELEKALHRSSFLVPSFTGKNRINCEKDATGNLFIRMSFYEIEVSIILKPDFSTALSVSLTQDVNGRIKHHKYEIEFDGFWRIGPSHFPIPDIWNEHDELYRQLRILNEYFLRMLRESISKDRILVYAQVGSTGEAFSQIRPFQWERVAMTDWVKGDGHVEDGPKLFNIHAAPGPNWTGARQVAVMNPAPIDDGFGDTYWCLDQAKVWILTRSQAMVSEATFSPKFLNRKTSYDLHTRCIQWRAANPAVDRETLLFREFPKFHQHQVRTMPFPVKSLIVHLLQEGTIKAVGTIRGERREIQAFEWQDCEIGVSTDLNRMGAWRDYPHSGEGDIGRIRIRKADLLALFPGDDMVLQEATNEKRKPHRKRPTARAIADAAERAVAEVKSKPRPTRDAAQKRMRELLPDSTDQVRRAEISRRMAVGDRGRPSKSTA